MKLSALKKSVQATNVNAAAGVWVSLDKYGKGLKFKIARANSTHNPKFRALSESLLAPYRDRKTGKLDFENVDADKLNKTLHEIYAQSVVVDWNVTDDDKQPIPYDASEVAALFGEASDLFDEVQSHAKDFDAFAVLVTEADEKN